MYKFLPITDVYAREILGFPRESYDRSRSACRREVSGKGVRAFPALLRGNMRP